MALRREEREREKKKDDTSLSSYHSRRVLFKKKRRFLHLSANPLFLYSSPERNVRVGASKRSEEPLRRFAKLGEVVELIVEAFSDGFSATTNVGENNDI